MSAAQQDELDQGGPDRDDYLDEQEEDSFPASDPHSDWSGPRPDPEQHDPLAFADSAAIEDFRP